MRHTFSWINGLWQLRISSEKEWEPKNFLVIGCRKQENHPEGLSFQSPHLSLRAVVGCPVHCCCLSLTTSTSSLNSSVICIRWGVIASVCWWVAWSNYLNSPSGLSPQGETLATAVEVLTIHCQSFHDIINVLLCRECGYLFHFEGAFYAFIILFTSSG